MVRAGVSRPHPLRLARADAAPPRGQAPPRRHHLGQLHAQAQPAEPPPPALPRGARSARLQAPRAPPRARATLADRRARRRGVRTETLFGDDAEADAFVYSLYADVLAGRVGEDVLARRAASAGASTRTSSPTIARVRARHDRARATSSSASSSTSSGRRPPDDFRRLRPARRALLQLPAGRVRRCTRTGALGPTACSASRSSSSSEHRFDGDALARSYLDLARRGHLRGTRHRRARRWRSTIGRSARRCPAVDELRAMVGRLEAAAKTARAQWRGDPASVPDYEKLVVLHNPRRSRGSG